MKRHLILLAALIFGSGQAQTTEPPLLGSNNWLYLEDDFRQDKVVLNNNLESLALISSWLEQDGIPTFIVIVPTRSRIAATNSPKTLPPEIVTQYDTALTFLRGKGVRAIDLNTPYRNYTAPDTLYFEQDIHWSDIGSFEAAKIVASDPDLQQAVAELPEIKFQMNAESFKPSPTNLRRLLAPTVSWPAPQNYAPITFRPTTEPDLLDDSLPSVVVMGSSYAKLSPAFTGGLSYYLSRDALNLAQDGQGIWNPMKTYILDDDWKASRPKVIIWEIPEYQLSRAGPSAGGQYLKDLKAAILK